MGLLNKDTLVCIDCETTGLDVAEDRVIEVAAVVFTFDGVLETFETLVDPQRLIPESSIEIHHVTDEMVQGKPTIEKVLPQLFKLVSNLPIVGHGVTFDINILANEAQRAAVPCRIKSNKVLDTLRLGRLYGESPHNSLEQLRKHFNIESEGAHRAMSDVRVNIEVFKNLVTKFKTTEQVLDRLLRPVKLRNMPLGKHKGRPFREVPAEYLRWAANKDFDQDLLFSIKDELKRRKKGDLFSQVSNPFQSL